MVLKIFKISLLRTTAVVSTAIIGLTTANASESVEMPQSASAAAPMAGLHGHPDPNAALRARLYDSFAHDYPVDLLNLIHDYARKAPPAEVAENVQKLIANPNTGGGMDLNGANLTRAYLNRAKLMGANLTDVTLLWANLTYANLSEANLTGANLTGATLQWANLTRANLTWAYALVEGKKITGENLKTYLANYYNCTFLV